MNKKGAGFAFGDDPVRPELLAAFERVWSELGRPGTWWTGDQRVAIAAAARRAFQGDDTADPDLPRAASAAAHRIAAEPAAASEAWVAEVIEGLGELRYVELVGIVARVVAVDTFCRLTGRGVVDLPEPSPGQPSREPPPSGLRRNRAWVSMAVPKPPHVLGAVPAAEVAMIDLTDRLYMTDAQMADPDFRRGDLHRTQMELVAATVSHGNECFY
jgi:hypothetical protein